MPRTPTEHDDSDARLVRSVLIIMALLLFAAFIYTIHNVLLLAFAAVLVAIIFTTIAEYIVNNSRLPHGVALALTILFFFSFLGLATYMFGSQVVSQLEALSKQLPDAWANLAQKIDNPDLENDLQAEISKMIPDGGSIFALFRGFVSGLGGAISGLVLALIGGIYLAAQPKMYFNGTLLLFPTGMRERVKDAAMRTGTSLRAWLGGQLIAMVAIGIITGLGLWAIGVPSPVALGLIAAVLEFVPFIGPILMAIPAVLLAMTIDMETTLMTVGLYLVIQQIEGNIIMPFVQEKSVNLPAALTMFALFAMGGMFGIVGVLLAAPLTVVVYVMIKALYVRDTLGEKVDLPSRT